MEIDSAALREIIKRNKVGKDFASLREISRKTN